jgi:pseudouridine synthase
VYVALYKPRGYVVTLKDDFGRKTIRWLMRGLKQRVYPVGRLDLDSEGLLILTDDGELAFRLSHPSFGIKKLYHVRVRGVVGHDMLSRFFEGIPLEDGHIAKAKTKILETDQDSTLLSIELQEGRKREIRRMCKIIGFPVIALTRVKYDEIQLTGLERGKWRYLSPYEVDRLKRKVGLK